jgi:membrane associated rhomboid family serine protease
MDERVDATVCYRHPDRPTRLACTECGRPICVDCSIDAAVGQKCPECAKPEGRAQVIDARSTVGRRAGFAEAPVSRALLMASAVIYVIGILSPDAEGWFLQNMAHANFLLAEGEYWRMVTHALLHGSTMHILFNMYALYLFGPELERQVGSLPFGMFYAAAAAGGSAAAYVLGPIDMVAVGASGAIFGLFGAWIYVSWRMRDTVRGRAQFSQLSVLLLINLALPLFVPNVAWEAHVGGLVFGIAIAAAWARFAARRSNAEQRRAVIAAAFLILAVAIVMVA